MNIEEMLNEIKKQFEDEENETSFGEPQAWLFLDNGRSIEVVHEEYALCPEHQFFSITLHCTDIEFDDGRFYRSNGIIDHDSSDYTPNISDIDLIRKPLERVLIINDKEAVI